MPLFITNGTHMSEPSDALIAAFNSDTSFFEQLLRRGGTNLERAFAFSPRQTDAPPIVLGGGELEQKYLICLPCEALQFLKWEEIFAQYSQALLLASEKQCESVTIRVPSFPNRAMTIIQSACAEFLERHDMRIDLWVSSRSHCDVPEDLLESLRPRFHAPEPKRPPQYTASMGTPEKHGDYLHISPRKERTEDLCLSEPEESTEDLCVAGPEDFFSPLTTPIVEFEEESSFLPYAAYACDYAPAPVDYSSAEPSDSFEALTEFLKENDAGFGETLLKYIDRTGKKDSEIYKKANIDRKLFSKIRNNPNYSPSKPTAIAFAIALELSLEETRDLIGRAGYSLSRASTFDRIIEYYITRRNYNIYAINEALFYFDQSLLGC